MNRLTFQKKEYDKLSGSQQIEIAALDARYLRHNFSRSERSDMEVSQLVGNIARTRSNPNSGVGGNLNRGRQRFARSVSILAVEHTVEGPTLVGHVSVADNASSRRSWPAGPVERQLKLHVPELFGKTFIDHRYIRLALLAIQPELQEQIASEDPAMANAIDGMIALSMSDRDPRQPLATYPWDVEHVMKTEFTTVGFEAQDGEDDEVYVFGEDRAPVRQERWVGAHEEVATRIVEKEGIDRILASAGVMMFQTEHGGTFEPIYA
jgi:hypothetical protein